MKNTQKIVSLLLALILCTSLLTIPASASAPTDPTDIVWAIPDEVPEGNDELDVYYPPFYWSATGSIVHGIVFTGRNGEVTVSYVTTSGDYTAKVFYRIQKQTASGAWSTVYTSPTTSGVFSVYIYNRHTLATGNYRVQTVGKVYDRNGNNIDNVTENSKTYVCS